MVNNPHLVAARRRTVETRVGGSIASSACNKLAQWRCPQGCGDESEMRTDSVRFGCRMKFREIASIHVAETLGACVLTTLFFITAEPGPFQNYRRVRRIHSSKAACKLLCISVWPLRSLVFSSPLQLAKEWQVLPL